MQFGFLLCIIALAPSADAANLRKERTQAGQEPVQVPAPVQVPVPVTDLMATQPQPAIQQESQPQPQGAQALTAAVQPQAALALAEQLPAQPTLLQPDRKNVTKIAFGQITDLGQEFHQLRQDDEAHVKQLGVDIHLREHLEQQLHEAEERLERDNGELAQATENIVTGPSADSGQPQNETGEPPSQAALVQAKSVQINAQTDQIAAATARDVKTLNADISNLHARDANEVKAIRGNAATRTALSAQIAQEREELLANSETLATNLGQIRDLVAPSNAAVVPASDAAPVDAASSSSEAAAEATAGATGEVSLISIGITRHRS